MFDAFHHRLRISKTFTGVETGDLDDDQETAVHSAIGRTVLGLAIMGLAGCGGSKMLMPPRVDLQTFQRIGIVEFKSNAKGDLRSLASHEFLEQMQASQPGVPVLELGSEELVLKAIGRDKIDSDAIRAVGQRYNVDAVIIGNLEVTDVKPNVNVSKVLTSMDVQADVEAALTTRLLEASGGATLWTRSSRWKSTVGHAGVDKQGGFHFGAKDPEAAYGSLVHNLVDEITQDFRPYWVKR
jgi:hypothetical protein